MPQKTERPARKAEGMGGLAKGLAIVEAFSAHPVMSVADAARAAGATRASARRCLITLTELGYVEHSGRVSPFDTSSQAGRGCFETRSARAAQPFLSTRTTSWRSRFRSRYSMMMGPSFIARAEAEHIVSTGVRASAHAPSRLLFATGRVLLGPEFPDQEILRRSWPESRLADNAAHADETIRGVGRGSIGSRKRSRRQRRGAELGLRALPYR